MKKSAAVVLAFFAAFLALAESDISKLDKNFAPVKVGNVQIVYRDIFAPPFEIEGFAWLEKGGALCRLPLSIKPADISLGVYQLARDTAGGVVRFRTDSADFAVRVRYTLPKRIFGHQPATGTSGIDFDIGGFVVNVNPLEKGKLCDPLERLVKRGMSKKMRDVAVYLPLYNGVKSLEIGLSPGAKIEPPTPHKIKKPVVFYGSSITQGGCASKPTNAYTTMLCRAVDAPQINLGFSGNAKGEDKMAELIASLDMSVFVYDYDHNAPNAEHLANTHERFFKIIRQKHPNLPIIMMSSVGYNVYPERFAPRAKIIERTYLNARAAGDKNVWLVRGADFTKDTDRFMWTVDNCHPNDYGFYLMFKHTLPALKEALGAR